MSKPNIIDEKERKIAKNRRITIIVISALLASVILFGIAVGTVVLVRRNRAVVMYEGVMIDSGVASYLAATYKSVYMQSIGEAYDTKEFWATVPAGEKKSYGEMLASETESYIKSVAVGAYLFDRYTTLTKTEKSAIERATGEILDFVSDNSIDKFNEECRAMGFDFDDFCRATELMYKSEMAQMIIYGYEGEALVDEGNILACEEYFGQFARVKILYIPTLADIARHEDGSFKTDSLGNYVIEYFTSQEKSERVADIERIRDLISGLESGGDEQMSPEYFDKMQKKYNYSSLYNESGYYFSPMSEYTAKFAAASSEKLPSGYRESFHKYMSSAVESAFSLTEGEYYMIEGDYGVTVIYKCQRESYAYLSSAYTSFFHDFYSDASDYLYTSALDRFVKDVIVKDKYYDIDMISLPYNCDYIATVE